jgi:hypothetical protein
MTADRISILRRIFAAAAARGDRATALLVAARLCALCLDREWICSTSPRRSCRMAAVAE